MLTLIGVVLITRPAFIFAEASPSLETERFSGKEYDIWGAVAAISSTLFGANVYILLRALKGLHYSVIMSNFGAFASVYTLIICMSIGALCWPACGRDRWLVVILGLFSFFGQILLTISLQMEQAGPVAIARCADIVFAFIWQILFFNEIPTIYSLLGALLVVSSVVLTALKKWAISQPRDAISRIRFRRFLID